MMPIRIYMVACAFMILAIMPGTGMFVAGQENNVGLFPAITPATKAQNPSLRQTAQLPHVNDRGSRTVEMVNGYRVVHGERPPINHDLVPADAMEEGILLLKFYRHMETHLEANPPTTDRDGIVRFNMTAPDTLNVRYGVRETNQYFRSPALRNTFTDRHNAWGFHLWYELRVDETTDIVRMMEAYRQLPEVEIAEPVFRKRLIDGVTDTGETASEILLTTIRDTWTPNDQDFSYQWHYHNTGQSGGTVGADISMLHAWAREKGHEDVIVAIIDDGIQYDHPDLAGNMWQDAVHPDGGYNFVDNNTTIVPGNHGTHVAGTVAAVSNNEIGVAGVAGGSGTGDGVRLMSAQVFRAQNNTQGGFHIAPIWAADQGAAISQNSWVNKTPGVFNQAELDAIDYFNTYGGGNVMEGGITIFAAGNSNSSAAYYPGYYSGTLAVASTDHNDTKASTSNYGDWIDIAAPGVNVYSTRVNDGYGYGSGTSMACPHVSGAAALLISKAHRNNFSLINDAVWDLLVDYTDDHYDVNQGFINELGSGRLNADASLEALATMLDGIPNPIDFTAVAVGTDQVNLSWSPNAQEHEVMIAWSDENSFGIPVTGTTYQVGGSLPGVKGTILYAGDQTGYEHTGLDINKNYYYKAFSVDDEIRYSAGVVAFARTQGPNLLVNGLNKQYTSFPPSQLPEEMVLQAHVKNTGTDLEESVDFNFTVNGDGFSATTILADPLPAGTEITITAEAAWVTAALSTGTYTIHYEADHIDSRENDRKDSIAFYVSENNIYARDHGLTRGGYGDNASILPAMKYTLIKPAVLSSFHVLWPELPDGQLDFEFALYEVNDQQGVLQTLISGEQFTRDGNTMSGALAEFYLENPVVLEFGHYMVAIRQLTGENISLGYDARKWGYFYIANDADDPDSFSKNADFGNLTLRMVLDDISVTTWTGTTDNDWHTATNWSDGIPDEQTNAVIASAASHQPTISSAAHVYDLLLESDASLMDNDNLTIHGVFTMEREIADDVIAWHFLSAPVAGMTIIGSDFVPNENPLPSNFDFYSFDESAELPWINIRGAGGVPNQDFDAAFVPGKGYLVAYDTDYGIDTFEFTGAMHTGTIHYQLAYTQDQAWSGHNLLGNPYPSAIQWHDDYATQFQQDAVAVYDPYREGGAGYINIQQGDLIPANQGFFALVESGENGNDFIFTNTMRAHGGVFMKNDVPEVDLLKLRLDSNGYWDETSIRIREGSAFDRDRQDAFKFFSLDPRVPQLFSKSADQVKLSINSIPEITEETTFPIGMRILTEGEYTISLQESTGFFTDQEIYLTDLLLEKTVELGLNMIHTFIATPDDDAMRFLLRFGPTDDSTSIEDADEPNLHLWFSKNVLFVDNPGESITAKVFDLFGRQFYSLNVPAGQHQFELNLSAGVYLVKSSGESQHKTIKIIIQ